jgi:hypothetical protein
MEWKYTLNGQLPSKRLKGFAHNHRIRRRVSRVIVNIAWDREDVWFMLVLAVVRDSVPRCRQLQGAPKIWSATMGCAPKIWSATIQLEGVRVCDDLGFSLKKILFTEANYSK